MTNIYDDSLKATMMSNDIPKTCGSCKYRRTFTPEGFPFDNCQLKRDLGYKNSQIYDHGTKDRGNFYTRIYSTRDNDCPLIAEYEKEGDTE